MNEKQLRMLLNGLMNKFNDIKGMDSNLSKFVAIEELNDLPVIINFSQDNDKNKNELFEKGSYALLKEFIGALLSLNELRTIAEVYYELIESKIQEIFTDIARGLGIKNEDFFCVNIKILINDIFYCDELTYMHTKNNSFICIKDKENLISVVYNNVDNSIDYIYVDDNNTFLPIFLSGINAETQTQDVYNLSIGRNYIIKNSTEDEYVSKSFSIYFTNSISNDISGNYDRNSLYLESIIYFQTSGDNDPITITCSCGKDLRISTEDNFNWTFSGDKYHILTFKKIGNLLFLTYNSYPMPPA